MGTSVEGYSNLSIRILAMRSGLPLNDIVDAGQSLDLWPSFREMLAAYEEANQ